MSLYHAKLSYWKFSTRIDCKYSNKKKKKKKKKKRNCCHSIRLYLFEIYDSELGLEATTQSPNVVAVKEWTFCLTKAWSNSIALLKWNTWDGARR